MEQYYLWFKAGHVIAVIAWMAGLFYLPRLFVYHADAAVGGETSELFKIMERRLLRAIMRPAAVVALLLGAICVVAGGWSGPANDWLWTKLLLVVALVGFHGLLENHTVQLARDLRLKPSRYFRVINEIPTVLLFGIVVLAVVKPF